MLHILNVADRPREIMSMKWGRDEQTSDPRPNLLPRSDMGDRTCSISSCAVQLYARRMCKHHYDTARRHGDPLWTLPEPPSLADRFWTKVEKGDGCWEWQAYRNPSGYGTIYFERRPWLAHRVSWMLAGRPLIEGEELDHLCRNPRCVNPDHLEPVTHRTNMRRSAKAMQTHCVHGHPFDDRNTYRAKNGTRSCRACHRNFENARRARMAA